MRCGYSLNVHPTETLPELRDSIDRFVCPIRDRVLPGQSMGVALRLGAAGVRALAGDEAARLGDELAARELIPFTFNGFPLSEFGSGTVKQNVYRPDWTEPERAELTLAIAEALATMSPDDFLTVSTLAGMFRPRGQGAEVEQCIARQLIGVARGLEKLEERSGKQVVLCLEPEPFTTLETTPETLAFFDRWLSSELCRRYLAVNLDVCHQAVVYEDLDESLAALTDAGIAIGKLHVSAALKLVAPTPAQLVQLARFDEPRYLHQTFVRRPDGAIVSFVDLDRFLADPGEAAEVRVHFHVPLDGETIGELQTTRDQAELALAWLRAHPGVCRHLVAETYTWTVLRERDLGGTGGTDPIDGISAELRWFMARMQG